MRLHFHQWTAQRQTMLKWQKNDLNKLLPKSQSFRIIFESIALTDTIKNHFHNQIIGHSFPYRDIRYALPFLGENTETIMGFFYCAHGYRVVINDLRKSNSMDGINRCAPITLRDWSNLNPNRKNGTYYIGHHFFHIFLVVFVWKVSKTDENFKFIENVCQTLSAQFSEKKNSTSVCLLILKWKIRLSTSVWWIKSLFSLQLSWLFSFILKEKLEEEKYTKSEQKTEICWILEWLRKWEPWTTLKLKRAFISNIGFGCK